MRYLNKGLGIWQILNSNVITDIIAKSGFNLTILDIEHGLHNPQTIQDCVFTAKSNSLFTVARLPCISYQYLVQIIDSGIDAILFPHVETTDQLKKIFSESLIYPKGNKSFSPFVTKYSYENSNVDFKANPSIGILIESIKGIKNINKLMQEDYLDFVYFGAYDLSVELNKPGDIFNDEIQNYLKILISHAKKNKKKTLSIFRNQTELKILLELGVDFPISSVDTSHLMQKLKVESEYFLKINN